MYAAGPAVFATDNDKIITRTHGTITHMAPEVIVESTHSKAADVYSFGVVLWETITCKKVRDRAVLAVLSVYGQL